MTHLLLIASSSTAALAAYFTLWPTLLGRAVTADRRGASFGFVNAAGGLGMTVGLGRCPALSPALPFYADSLLLAISAVESRVLR